MMTLDFSGFPFPAVEPAFTMYLSRMANLDNSKVVYCVWHHTGGRDHDSTAAATNRYHIEEKGWAGIGYHGQIRWDGALELGRPITKQGVHASQVNAISLGFCMSGNFEIGFISDRPNQYKSGVALAKLVSKAFPEIQHVRHKDVGSTLCNGKNFPWEQFLKDIEEDLTMATKSHIVERGERLFSIATAYDISRTDIQAFNPQIPAAEIGSIEVDEIIFLAEPQPAEVTYASHIRKILHGQTQYGLQLEEAQAALKQKEDELATEVKRTLDAVSESNDLRNAGRALHGNALWNKFID